MSLPPKQDITLWAGDTDAAARMFTFAAAALPAFDFAEPFFVPWWRGRYRAMMRLPNCRLKILPSRPAAEKSPSLPIFRPFSAAFGRQAIA